MTVKPLLVAMMGEAGAGKSHFAASFPKPMLVLHFDPMGKAQPYLDRGREQPLVYTDDGVPFIDVWSNKSDATIVRLMFFHDIEPTLPVAFDLFFNFVTGQLSSEVQQGVWKSVVVETFTGMDLFARYRRTYGPLKSDKPNIPATEDIEQMCSRFVGMSLHANVLINCHIDEKPVSMDPDAVTTDHKGNKLMTGGQLLATPKAPGRLQKGIGSNFAGELYHMYVPKPGRDGVIQRVLQTQPDGRFACVTRINAPDRMVDPTYAKLWTNATTKGGETNGTANDQSA